MQPIFILIITLLISIVLFSLSSKTYSKENYTDTPNTTNTTNTTNNIPIDIIQNCLLKSNADEIKDCIALAMPKEQTHRKKKYSELINSKNRIQTDWNCISLDYGTIPKHILARKSVTGALQCARFKDHKPCTFFKNKKQCEMHKQNSFVIPPSSCCLEGNKNNKLCKNISKKIWQCYNHKIGPHNNVAIALRRLPDRNLQCLGSSDECFKYNNLLTCNNMIKYHNIDKSDDDDYDRALKYITCGDRLKTVEGISGYDRPGHFCNVMNKRVPRH